ncbi:Gfo/Idh/MocA family protein [Actinocatenispora rupis]|uniref:Oxidoreductase n=1 Tax=Actinocatenispora rupis TaxID=519421 RepID=A0A8J3JAP2_9ACTN|nr:Gfo/Idh/MocA family oxidoreductase [Actinocatenispora rupis]GID14866.1 oxidoreductase [Actinocatenispora rupis]
MSTVDEVGIGMVGTAFMGAAHSQAWRTVGRVFDLPVRPRMVAVCGRDEARTAAAADRLGWSSYETDWRALIARDDVQLVDVCTPGDSHAEIAIAALRAGKHVLCEKPLANTVAEAEAMAAAAREAGTVAMTGFTYRRVPALALMAEMVAAGRIGDVRHVRAAYLQDWLVDPASPLTWRLQAEHAGSGALGDLGAHIVDATRYLTGLEFTAVSALTETFVTERPTGDGGTGAVTVDDTALFLARLSGGAVGTFEATRYATGRKNGLRIELNGTRGTLAFDLERLNELEFHDGTRPQAEAGFTRILVTEPIHPYLSAWWPPGHLLGYEHAFTHQARDLLTAIAAGADDSAARPAHASFDDGLAVQRVLDAVASSAADGTWTTL